MNLEHELRHALERKSPSPGFEDRVLTRIASRKTSEDPAPRAASTRWLLPIAATLLLTFGGTYYLWERQHEERVQTERAARDLAVALQIASTKVSAVQVKLQEIIRP
jgi:hypothetical protein